MRLFILYIFTIFYTQLHAQREADNWLFGSRCWANFSTGQPQVISQPAQRLLTTGAACMSDKNGQLLYYANNHHVYNRLHQPMPGASGLYATFGSFSVPVITVPYPGHDSLYYFFYFDYEYTIHRGPYLRYAIINMKLQNGLGDLMVRDQLVLPDLVCLKMTASLHCNKKDIWLIGHLKNSANYFSILINSNGLSTTPVYSPGQMISDADDFYNHQGPMKASPLGDKVAAAFKGNYEMVELMDFNSQTGALSGSKTVTITPAWHVPITTVASGIVGMEFSSTGSHLYVNGTYITDSLLSHFPSLLYQFNAGLPTASAVQASRYLIDSSTYRMYAGMQLANNGKIYATSGIDTKLHVINNPDLPGAAAGFANNAVDFGLATTDFDLPYFMQSYLRYPMISTGNCQFQNIDFSIQNPVGISSIIWNFGDPTSGANNTITSFTANHIFSSQGVYTVKAILINSNGCGADTITKIVHAGPFKVFLGNDTTLCKGDTLKLKVTFPSASNYWSDNTTDSILKITHSGKYWVRVNIGECVASDTITVLVKDLPVFTLGKDTTICSNESLSLSPSFVPVTASYLWSTGATTQTITVHNNGSYWLQVTDSSRCIFKDTINVSYKSLPQFSLGADTSLCQTTLLLNAVVPGANSYLWSTSATDSTISVGHSGFYWADVTKDNCTYRDSILINFKAYPKLDIGNDTTLCEGTTRLLDAQNTGATYYWQDGSGRQTFLVVSKGRYFVQVDKAGCQAADTVFIDYSFKPSFTLGPDQTICNGLTVMLRPNLQNTIAVNYSWQDGSSQSSYTVTQPGLYTLQLTNDCGERVDSINVIKGLCKLYVPTAFSPNGDGKNDVFKPSYGENITNYRLLVYNRWGEKIFESTNMNDGWDGKYKRILQPEGIYTWMIGYNTLSKPDKEILKGTLLLIR